MKKDRTPLGRGSLEYRVLGLEFQAAVSILGDNSRRDQSNCPGGIQRVNEKYHLVYQKFSLGKIVWLKRGTGSLKRGTESLQGMKESFHRIKKPLKRTRESLHRSCQLQKRTPGRFHRM